MTNSVSQKKAHGSVFGGTLLITGSCVGAGMLGLPILTGLAGFFPSMLMFALACIFMTGTGFLLIEIHQWFDKSAHFSTIVSKILGPIGNAIAWLSFLLLFYSLLVAYIAMSSHHFALGLDHAFNLHLPVWVGGIFFVALFGWIVYLGTKSVDHFNRVLMVGKIIAFFALVSLALPYVKPKLLHYTDPSYCLKALPILVISFGFHNMIPSLQHYLGGDTKRVKQSLFGGALLTLGIYLIWEIVVLGSLPIDGPYGIMDSFKQGLDGAAALKGYSNYPAIGNGALALAFFAILTSFLAQTLSLVHFLTAGLKLQRHRRENIAICTLTLLPPLLIAAIYPTIAYKALNFAGGICAVVLFGILPVLMAWRGRYYKHFDTPYRMAGGKPLLLFFISFASLIFAYQLYSMI